jgi:plastocyanin
MKKLSTSMFALAIILFLSGINFSQTTHDVTVQNFSFSPGELTINVGDEVRWTNIFGHHNVKADDNSFTSGAPAMAPWEFTHTFTTVGLHPYYCEPHGGPGGSGMAGVVVVQNPVSVDDDKLVADKFELMQNFSNPFNPSTKIEYRISDQSFVTLKIYNILGDEIATLADEYKPAGRYEVEFNLAQVSRPEISSGVYFYQLQSGSFIETKKMVLLR